MKAAEFQTQKFLPGLGTFFLVMFFVHPVSAHIKDGELGRLIHSSTAATYLTEGFLHILPYGYDHILFVLSLFLLSPRFKSIVWQTTTFTLAHSISLGLTIFHVISPPGSLIEILIALSILYVSLENILSSRLSPSRIGIIFFFGLIHGMGFASGLAGLGLKKESYLTCLITFNLGVELGQITVILIAYYLLARWFSDPQKFRKLVVIPLSIAISIVAFIFTIQRIFY